MIIPIYKKCSFSMKKIENYDITRIVYMFWKQHKCTNVLSVDNISN
ncbi:hypothetical protein KSS87_003094 [Heliosperma pusillum]|nr:hypothetical protein KSS87_003094 [Heliosperma pusillum]